MDRKTDRQPRGAGKGAGEGDRQLLCGLCIEAGDCEGVVAGSRWQRVGAT